MHPGGDDMAISRRGAPVAQIGLALLTLVAAPALSAAATQVGGGGGKATDCLTTFFADVTFPAANPRHVRCTDGDPACDADMEVNGVCTIPLVVCANSTFSSACSLSGVSSIRVESSIDNGDPKFDPDFQALQSRIDSDIQPPTGMTDVCATASNIRVPIHGPLGNNKCRRGKTKRVRIFTDSQPMNGRVFRDVDVIRFQCDPNPVNGCNPQTLFSSTFDRIQKQVFNQSCAVSGCHDSQSFASAGVLLLETGASHTNLVDVAPFNFAASGAGWKRVQVITPDVSGDAETSFLHRKVQGDLPDASYGARMPLNRPRLHPTLRELIRLWILDGAPSTGWIPGTF
jgi:hypothetical protein